MGFMVLYMERRERDGRGGGQGKTRERRKTGIELL
jgi:hypothetical protein